MDKIAKRLSVSGLMPHTGIKGMGIYVIFQPLCDLIHVGTSLPFVI